MDNNNIKIHHHGAVDGVTGSCHELRIEDSSGNYRSLLIDCGLFQGNETGPDGASENNLQISFDIEPIQALIITHVHIDHLGRLPYLLAAGYRGPIICSPASAKLLPLVLEDSLKIGFTRDRRLIERVLKDLSHRIISLPIDQWHTFDKSFPGIAVRLQRAGHILGSTYIEIKVNDRRIVLSGDLGAPNTPLLPEPMPPERADILILESTYGDRCHEDRTTRVQRLRDAIDHALQDGGTVLIPAFSIGRTQELLYELEELFHDFEEEQLKNNPDGSASGDEASDVWSGLQVILDSPLAARFTRGYRLMSDLWDEEASRRIRDGRYPLAFDRLVTVDSHTEHLNMVNYLAESRKPAIVIAASGMCAGGRIINYLKAMLGEPRHDILFIGYQAAGTPGRIIQRYGPRGGYVILDGQRYTIRAQVRTIGGYSAHADQQDLLNFVSGIAEAPEEIRLVHGDEGAKAALAAKLQDIVPDCRIVSPSYQSAD